MPTLADFTEEQPGFVPEQDVQPDMVKHDPNTFAALTAQSALKTMYQQGLSPTGDDIKGVYSKALDAANDFHKNLFEKQTEANLDIQKRQAAISTGTLAAEKTTESAVAQAQAEREEQFRQGPSAVAAAKAQGNTGLVSRMSDADLTKLDGLSSAYDTTQNLHGYFKNMIQNTAGAGGVLSKGLGALFTQPELTSPQLRAFNAYLDGSLVPLGKGIFGDAAVAATKENIQAQMRDMLPNPTDNDQSGGQKIFMLKDRIMQNLQAMRDDRANAGFDTTPLDRKIAQFNSDFRSSATQKYNPLANSQPLVQAGTSPQANATTASVNAGANAGIPPIQATGVSGSTLASGAQPGPQPQPGPQTQTAAPQDLWGFGTFNQ
jgi:hypothetical protein